MATSSEVRDSAITAAISALGTDLSHLEKLLADDGLADQEQVDRIVVLQEFERFRNRLSVIDHLLVDAAARFDLAGHVCQPNVARMLTATLRISEREAAARVRGAEALGERVTMVGGRLEPVRPRLAAAQSAGDVTPEHADLIIRGLAEVDGPGFDPAQVTLAEQQLTDGAVAFSPRELKALIRRVVDWIDPDGTIPDDRLDHDRRHVIIKHTKSGAYVGEFRLTAAVGSKLVAVLGGLARPQNTSVVVDGTKVVEVDERVYPQRLHDALGELCDRVLRAGSAPGVGGAPASVIVTIDYEDLLRKTGWATTTDGTPLPVQDLLAMADEAEIITVVRDSVGAILNLGRARRLASLPQVQALIARDGGCSFPSCERPPEWCERHHITEWVAGGQTDLDNLTLLCRYHHHHFNQRGWNCRLNQERLPEWRPPRWIDREQRPIMNTRIGQGRWLDRRLSPPPDEEVDSEEGGPKEAAAPTKAADPTKGTAPKR